MRVKDFMASAVVWCTPWDTAQAAASLMKVLGVGAIPVVADPADPLLEGIDAREPSSQNPRCEQAGTVHRHRGSSGYCPSCSCRASRKHNQGDFQTRETTRGNPFREGLLLLWTAP